MISRPHQAGFSLIELIVVVVLLGVLASGAGMLIANPLESYQAQVRRQQLVDQGEMALRQIARDVRRALPNSIRINPAGSALEMVNTVDGARYRDEYGGAYTGDVDFVLDFASADTVFNLLGPLRNATAFSANNRVVIYNTSENIYAEAVDVDNQGIITPAGITLGLGNLGALLTREDQITLSAPFLFTQQSPGNAYFLLTAQLVISAIRRAIRSCVTRVMVSEEHNPPRLPTSALVPARWYPRLVAVVSAIARVVRSAAVF